MIYKVIIQCMSFWREHGNVEVVNRTAWVIICLYICVSAITRTPNIFLRLDHLWENWVELVAMESCKGFTYPTKIFCRGISGFVTSCPCGTTRPCTVYPKKYAHGFVVLCFVVVMQSFIMNSHEVFIHIHQGCFAGTGAIVRLPQCQWSKPDGYGKISQCITTTKHSKAKTVCIFLGIYCILVHCLQIDST